MPPVQIYKYYIRLFSPVSILAVTCEVSSFLCGGLTLGGEVCLSDLRGVDVNSPGLVTLLTGANIPNKQKTFQEKFKHMKKLLYRVCQNVT